ncbi:pyridoxal phosphate-dependent aminotransferase [Saccharopolyspora spinosa]|uniref:Aspartate aminotransferase n=1 Tax=Saccharopolyspora spinosa TaxID=60894 RepID=A0A2N3Y5N9_SACSN|nr:aminotransferase class I/II-fold pyridoxal phosphate-dependent enzyme [Saccharopolyspora spinosa]PKW18220.1 aspartate aminotransferase [Saccharopolyspora spinosa]
MVRFQPSLAITRVKRSSLRPAGAVPPAGTVSLATGEPDFPTPEPIVEACRRALADGYTHYGDLNGDPELREVIAAAASGRSGQAYSEGNVAVTHGGAAAINAAVLAAVNPGDRVVIPEPTYSLYPDAVRLAGGEPVLVPTTSDHRLDLDALADALRGARMIVLCNPVNPTGTVFNGDELGALGALLDGTDVLVLADEAYAEIVYDGVPFTSALAVESLRERLIYCQTLSKTYAMTGWRVGYVVAPVEMTAPIRHVHRTFNSALNAAAQRAAITALRLGPELAAPMLRAYQERRDLVAKRLAEMDEVEAIKPEGAFYAFARYRCALRSEDVVQRLLAGGVAVRAGSEYGPSGEGHVRLSFAADFDTLDEGLNRMQKTLARL